MNKTDTQAARELARSLEHNPECDLYECADCDSAALLRRLGAQSDALRELVEVANGHHCDCTRLPFCKGRVCCELLHVRNAGKKALDGK